MPAGEPDRIVADVSRLKDEVGWAGETPLDEALDQSIAFEKKRMA
jgi:nucleoside-diphosphate-sugar epimerase